MYISKKPDYAISNKLGNVLLFREAFPDSKFNELKECFNWKRNSMHGNHDRMIWDGTKMKKNKEQVKLLNKIGKTITKTIKIDGLGTINFMNYYRNKSNRTFWHRDEDINPGEYVVMVSFGASRTLTFTDYKTGKTYPVKLNDRDIIAFDFDFNMNTFHAVESTKDDVGERISLQYFEMKDSKKWGKALKKWKETESDKKKGISKRRSFVNNQLRSKTRSKRKLETKDRTTVTKKQRKSIGVVIFHGGCFSGGSHTYDKELFQKLKDDKFIVSRCKFNLLDSDKALKDCKEKVFLMKRKTSKVYGIGISSGGFQAFRVNGLDGVIGVCPVLHPIQRLESIKKDKRYKSMYNKTLKHFKSLEDANEKGDILVESCMDNSLIIAGLSDKNVPAKLIKKWNMTSNILWLDGGHEICNNIPFEGYDKIKEFMV